MHPSCTQVLVPTQWGSDLATVPYCFVKWPCALTCQRVGRSGRVASLDTSALPPRGWGNRALVLANRSTCTSLTDSVRTGCLRYLSITIFYKQPSKNAMVSFSGPYSQCAWYKISVRSTGCKLFHVGNAFLLRVGFCPTVCKAQILSDQALGGVLL